MESAQVLLIAAVGIGVDQLSKIVVVRQMGGGTLSFGRFLRIRVVNNIAGSKRVTRLLLMVWVLAAASILVLVHQRSYFEGTIAQVGLGLALGGAASNLVDRLRLGQIVDFIDLRFWPVFNLADVAIVAGVLLAFLYPLGAVL